MIWILVLIGIIVLFILISKYLKINPLKKVLGYLKIFAWNLGQRRKKKSRKDRIIKILENKKEASNSELRKKLKVTSRSIVKYMNELEKEGKVKQTQKSGRYTKYRLKSSNTNS